MKKTVFLCFLFPPLDNEVVLTHNKSGRFESRFVSVGIQESPSIWLKGMEGSALGVWVAHGEGSLSQSQTGHHESATRSPYSATERVCSVEMRNHIESYPSGRLLGRTR